MKFELDKEDVKYLIYILEEHHKIRNMTTIDKCRDECWYKNIKSKFKGVQQ